jgi:hypothetical protein
VPYVVLARVPGRDRPIPIGAFNHRGRAEDVLDHVRALGYDGELHPLWRGVDVVNLPPAAEFPADGTPLRSVTSRGVT